MDEESESLIAVMDSKLIDQVRRLARTLHVAKRTEEAYTGWISRLPVVLSPAEVAKILDAVQPRPKRLMCCLMYVRSLFRSVWCLN